jgi:hypothetical protein
MPPTHSVSAERRSRCALPAAGWGGGVLAAVLALAAGGCGPARPEAPPVAAADANADHDDLRALARSDHVALLERCLSHYDRSYADYTCIFVKQERIEGRLRPPQTIAVSFRDEPFSVGMRWLRNPPAADRLLYVAGRYDGQMLVRPTSPLAKLIAPSVLRPPDGPQAMRSTLRPVTRFGFRRALEGLLAVYGRGRDRGGLEEAFGGYADVAGRRAVVLVRRLPQPAADDLGASPLTKIYVDVRRLVPILVEGYAAGGQFQCRYLYKDVRFNVGLGREDFSPERFDLDEPR